MTQLPVPVNVTTPAEIEQGPVTVNVTGFPEFPPVAATEYVFPVYASDGTEVVKVITCIALVTKDKISP